MMKRSMIAAALALGVAWPTFAQEGASEPYAKAGSELTVGESATVPHLVPKGPEVPIELTITAIEEGSKADLAGFQLPADLKDARPVYVRYEYVNKSDEDLSAQAIGAFVAIDDRDQAHAPVSPMSGGSFTRCATPPAADLTKNKSGEGCAMFMIHENGRIVSAAYKGHYRDEGGANVEADFPIYNDPVRWVVAEADQPAAAPKTPVKTIVR